MTQRIAHVYQLRGLGGLGSSVSQVRSICDTELEEARTELRSSRRVEITLILGGALLTLTTMILDELGYRPFSRTLTAISVLGGAGYAIFRLTRSDS